MTASRTKPLIAVYKFSSCDGCQLQILNLEDELLDLLQFIDIGYFLEATRAVVPGPYDIGIVEGSVSTPHEVERIKKIRQECDILIAIGSCAVSGGVQALRNFDSKDRLAEIVYQHPEFLDSLEESQAVADHVKVDFELRGCPINKYQLVELLSSLLQNRKANIPEYSLCLDCKMNGISCVMVSKGIPCLGPLVKAGCGVVCPSVGRGCYGCFGSIDDGNAASLAETLKEHERYPGEAVHLLRHIGAGDPNFMEAAEILVSEGAAQ